MLSLCGLCLHRPGRVGSFASAIWRTGSRRSTIRTHHNGAIRQIENRPLILLHIDQQKIDHSPTGEAIPKVPQRPLHNQGQADAGDKWWAWWFSRARPRQRLMRSQKNPISNPVFHGAVESANRLKAAPVFSVWVRRKNRELPERGIKANTLRHEVLCPTVK